MEKKKALSEALLQIKAIKLNSQNPFTWASGIKSPIYCDNRLTLSYPKVRNLIKSSLADASKLFGDFDIVVGVATAGIPHGALLADALDKPFAYVRDKSKSHGRKNQIEGKIKGNEKVLVVEDLISTGGSCIKAAKVLEEAGCTISGIISIFTYQFDISKEKFESLNYKYHSLTDYSTVIDIAHKTGYIKQNEISLLKEWRQSPQTWLTK